LRPLLASLDLEIHDHTHFDHTHFERLKSDAVHRVGVKVDLLVRLGFGEPISPVPKDPEDPASDARTGFLDDSTQLVAKLLDLPLHGGKRGVDSIV
jgi:hypothetical protein